MSVNRNMNTSGMPNLFPSLVLAAAVTLLPFPTGAQTPTGRGYDGEVEIGAGYVSEDAFKFGEYSGLEEQGLYGNAGFSIEKSSDYDSGSAAYWELEGMNLGLATREVTGEYGVQGKYELFFNYDQIPHNRYNDARTPYLGPGTADQTLPGSFTGATSTSGMGSLFSNLNTFELETDRTRIGGGFSFYVREDWEITGRYRHETKDGTEALGSLFGTNGGNPRSAVLAVPVDYNFDDFDLTVQRSGRRASFQFGYHLSFFRNDDHAVTWDNAYDDPGNWCTAFCGAGNSPVEFSQGGRGRISLDPDNRAHRFDFNGVYRFDSGTRLSAKFSYGWVKQDDTFLPYSTIDEFNTVSDLPRTDLDGKIETLFANINFSTRPMDRLDLRAQLVYDDRNNKTPRDVYLIVHNDSNVQDDAADSEDRRYNRPYSLETLQLKLDAGYRLGPRNRLSLGYRFKDTNRDYSEVSSNHEHEFSVKLATNAFESAGGWVKYMHSVRTGSDYIDNQPFLDGHAPEVIAAITADDPDALYENDPLMRKYYQADRDRDQLSAAVNVYRFEKLGLSVIGKYNHDNFGESEVGLQKSKNGSVTLDISYSPSQKLDAYTWLSYENYRNLQRGYSRRGGNFPPDAVRDPGSFWTVDTEDDVYSAGAGLDWNVLRDKFDLSVDYVYSHAVTETVPDSVSLDFTTFPDNLTTKLHSLSLTGEYDMKANQGFRIRIQYERSRVRDFALDNVTVDTLSNVLLPGYRSPNYSVFNTGLSYFYRY